MTGDVPNGKQLEYGFVRRILYKGNITMLYTFTGQSYPSDLREPRDQSLKDCPSLNEATVSPPSQT